MANEESPLNRKLEATLSLDNASAGSPGPSQALGDLPDLSKLSAPNLGEECPLYQACDCHLQWLSPLALSQEPAQGPAKEAVFPGLAGSRASGSRDASALPSTICAQACFLALQAGIPSQGGRGEEASPPPKLGAVTHSSVTCPRAPCQPREGAGGGASRVCSCSFLPSFPWVRWALTPF